MNAFGRNLPLSIEQRGAQYPIAGYRQLSANSPRLSEPRSRLRVIAIYLAIILSIHHSAADDAGECSATICCCVGALSDNMKSRRPDKLDGRALRRSSVHPKSSYPQLSRAGRLGRWPVPGSCASWTVERSPETPASCGDPAREARRRVAVGSCAPRGLRRPSSCARAPFDQPQKFGGHFRGANGRRAALNRA